MLHRDRYELIKLVRLYERLSRHTSECPAAVGGAPCECSAAEFRRRCYLPLLARFSLSEEQAKDLTL